MSAPDAPERPRYLYQLGALLLSRFYHMNNIDDLEKAIQAFDNAVVLTKEETEDLALYLTNLGSVLTERYTLTREQEDIQRSILVLERALTIKASQGLINTVRVRLAVSLHRLLGGLAGAQCVYPLLWRQEIPRAIP